MGTVMSNYGLERHCSENGRSFFRVDVGDRWIAQALKRWGLEASGHIIDHSFLPVGDGLWIAQELSTKFLKGMKAPLFPAFTPYPVIQCALPITENFSFLESDTQSYLHTLRASLEPHIRVLQEQNLLFVFWWKGLVL